MDAWNNFRNYFIKESVESTPDIFERARIRMTFTLCFIANTLLVLVDAVLIISRLYFSLGISVAIHVAVLTCICLIKFRRNHAVGARIVIVTIFIGLCLDILFSETIALVDILWFATLILFAFFTAGSRWAGPITVGSIVVCVIYMVWFFYDNFHDESIYTTKQVIPVLITIVFGFTLMFLFVREARAAETEAEIKLKENILSLSDLNKELERVNGELQSSNKNLETFSYSVSHDLRAPVRTILGYSGLLSKKYESALGAGGMGVVETITNEVKKMDRLITDLLSLSRSESTPLGVSKVDTLELVREVISDHEKSEGTIRAEIRVGGLPTLPCDRSLLKQVWINLFSNAIKYSSLKEKPLVEIGSSAVGTEYIFYVKDNGAGFDMKDANKLFTAFQRLHTEREFRGTGVGLAIVRQIITRHKGRVWAESSPGNGATFYFSLPAAT